MDFFTHFLVPYILLFFLNSKYKLEGSLGGISVDFDVFILFIGILFPQLFIFSHRGITHSFVFGFIYAIIFLYFLTRTPIQNLIRKISKRDIKLNFSLKTVTIAFFGVSIHLLLDFLTTGGVPLFYPFSMTLFSAELFYAVEGITILAALVLGSILFFDIDKCHQKIAMIFFIIFLISLGGIRAYEKNTAIHSFQTEMQGNYSEIKVYPTADIFTWKVVLINPQDQEYAYYTYHSNTDNKDFQGNYSALNIENGDYDSAILAIEKAEKKSMVEYFRWRSYHTCINAKYDDGIWKITYSDFAGRYATRENLSVYIADKKL